MKRRLITAREQHELLSPWTRLSYTDAMGEQDWNEIYPDLPDTVHRGIGITLPDDLHRMVHDPSIPVEQRAHALLKHIGTPEARVSPWGNDWRQGLGTSWSGDDGVADDFARRMADQHTGHNDKQARENDDHTWGTDEDGDPVGKPGTAVMLHAHLPQLDEIDDDPNGDGSGQRYTYHGHGEQEVPVHQGTAMHIKGISWRPVLSMFHPDYVNDPEEYTHHEFGEGTYHMARLAATYWHITDNPDFRPDPEHRPELNTTMGGEMKPGLFLTRNPDHWMQSYGYWRPYVSEIEGPDDVGEGSHLSPERYVPADQYHQLKVKRTIPIDAYARETYNEPGWVEGDSGTDFQSGAPLERGSWGIHRRNWDGKYQYPGTVMDQTPEWRSDYENRVRDYQQRTPGIIAGRSSAPH